MGTFYVSLKKDDSWIEYISEGKNPPWWEEFNDNKMVRGGGAYIEDKIVGNNNSQWLNSVISHMAIGTEDATNFGTEGPSTGAKPKDGDWQGSSSLDFRLTLEVARSEVAYSRIGDVLIISAVFQDSDIHEVGATATFIRELGLFLSEDAPTGNPFDLPLQQEHAMIVRSVRYSETTNDYIDDPLVKEENGEPLELFYKMRLA
ncbi:MAG: hypothetical protein GF411_17135 [Candidatus Lokiarchaeota archaeon]|nr:hypothetical protein [Candidatus Lokiarchaeota archaeon]